MSVIVSLLLLLSFFLIVGIIIFSLLKLAPKSKNISSKRPYYALAVYFTILVISIPVYAMFTSSDDQYEMVEKRTVAIENQELEELLINGLIEKIPQERIISNWNVDYPYDSIVITSSTYDGYNLSIFIERTEANDEKLEVYYVRGTSMLDGVDISSHQNPIYVGINERQMTVEMPVPISININKISFPFSFQQIGNERTEDEWYWWNSHSEVPNHLLYLKVPKGIKITNETPFMIDYVNN
ncbi:MULTISPECIES: hypothetical protein [Sutcliffiella]|uniref:Uncharacterized protein n=1 Tax=Sutcliffiella cohnii TaxID=33932 RepID=A0A223KLK2_9BACI|nr:MULTISPECIES: hypothetical protein [Sutcliffiella]AST90380.1 hypothetical protein BC6307_03385 [Sutcliffiella cohnii]MED4017505.1 hypothetical protein [Sutcliffiella cohnii]WBL16035.1 hypothetical protein O1A01_05210 [Sutcliffiella sp. NC1]